MVRSSIFKYNNNNNNNNIYLLQFGCNPVAVVMLHVYKILNWLLLNLYTAKYKIYNKIYIYIYIRNYTLPTRPRYLVLVE
jgi:hypothetical protein